MLSVVIPAWNAAPSLPATLACLAGRVEIVVADGGSQDATAALALAAGARVVIAPRGRGGQLAAGVAAAQGDWLLLLHADTMLSAGWPQAVDAFIARHGADRAGYGRLALDSAAPQARRLERLVAWRSRALGLPYGDQALLISRTLLDRVGGIRALPLMEDVDLVRRIGRRRLAMLHVTALTSARRWEAEGWTRRSARNLSCVMLYALGVPPRLLVRWYG